ncbi:MAG: TldD/PmbA family protein [Bacillota bacterium]
MKTLLTEAVRGKDADYLEIRFEESHVTRIVFRGPTLDNVGQSVVYGGNIRALVDGGWGFVSFNRLEDLAEKVALAIRQARLIGRARGERSQLAPAPVVQDVVALKPGFDPREVPLDKKMSVLEGYNRAVLGFGDPIKSSAVNYQDKYSKLYFANSEGTYIEQEKGDVGGNITAVAVQGALTQVSGVGFGGSKGFTVALGHENEVLKAAKTAADLIKADPIKGGEYTVITDPILTGIFAHEAFGHLSEGDNVYEDENLQKVMTLGAKFGEPILNIYDTGTDEGARGYLKYDDEGVPTEKTYLIKEGVLVGRLHSRETAGKMGERVTGNARAIDYRFPPICRMRNTSIERGESTFEDMLKDVKLGVYALKAYGGQTNGEMFTFAASEARMIRDGKLAELVRDVNLTGNVFTTLKNIDMVGSDFESHESGGGCGKGAQAPLPTSEWAPHMRIQKVVIGGRS